MYTQTQKQAITVTSHRRPRVFAGLASLSGLVAMASRPSLLCGCASATSSAHRTVWYSIGSDRVELAEHRVAQSIHASVLDGSAVLLTMHHASQIGATDPRTLAQLLARIMTTGHVAEYGSCG